MIPRWVEGRLRQALSEAPAVCLLGPRQSGKTTLALALAEEFRAVYLDLESPQDLAKLQDPEAYLGRHLGRLVILDELHRMPSLLPVLRVMIDRSRRAGYPTGLYLLLGSASLDLMRGVSETLAGRVRFVELTPFFVLEEHGASIDQLWLRGGFPPSLLAPDDGQSFRWRLDLIRTYLERELRQYDVRLPAETLRRLWTMLAHLQGSLLNLAELARSTGLDGRTVNRYVDLFCDLFLLRRLPPWHAHVGKRLVKSPKLYVRDSGLVHALLGIRTLEELLGHPVAGPSWEGFVIENLAACAPEGTELYFYRTAVGAEIDLLLKLPGHRQPWAVEVKRGLSPRIEKGFRIARADVQPERCFVVYGGSERFLLSEGIEAIPLVELCTELSRA